MGTVASITAGAWAGVKSRGKKLLLPLGEFRALATLSQRIRTILPEEYQDTYQDVEPVSMGSAGLKFAPDGRVAWDEIWGSFCDLAMAGGPPHKGTLLLPASPSEIDAEPERYLEVVDEICRGIALVTGLPATPSPVSGWVRVECDSAVSADWLARAIVMENVSARSAGASLELPAGPAFRVHKEIKNVITSVAKTVHYWQGHVLNSRQKVIEDLFATMASEAPLIQPAVAALEQRLELEERLARKISATIHEATGLKPWPVFCAGWVGLVCSSARSAIWMMRALVVANVMARREDTVLFVPVNPATDPSGEIVSRAVIKTRGLARLAGIR